jgi:hypothetical protein
LFGTEAPSKDFAGTLREAATNRPMASGNRLECLRFLQLLYFHVEGFAADGERVFVTAGFDVLIAP